MAKTPTKSVPKTPRKPRASSASAGARFLEAVQSLPASHCAVVLCFVASLAAIGKGFDLTSVVTIFVITLVFIVILELLRMWRDERDAERDVDRLFERRTNEL